MLNSEIDKMFMLHHSEGKDSKRPRTSKGFHCSRNAYMLVYRQKRENIGMSSLATLRTVS